MPEQLVGLPKKGPDRDHTPKLVRIGRENAVFIPGGAVIDGALSRDPSNTDDVDVLQPGLLMGRESTDQKFAPSIIGAILNAEIATATAIEVTPAVAVEIVRRFGATGTFNLTGPEAAAGTVATEIVTYTDVDVVTGIITVDAITLAFIAGSFIQPEDGSEDPVALIDNNEFPKVTDRSDTSVDVPFNTPLIGGQGDSSQIINFPSDTSLRSWLVGGVAGTSSPGGLNTEGRGEFHFDHLTRPD